MEFLPVILVSFFVIMVVGLLVLNKKLSENRALIKELEKQIFGNSFKEGINYKINQLNEKTSKYSDNLKQILKGLPNLFKDDLDLYKEVNGYDHYFLTLDTMNGEVLSVVFYCDRCDNSYYVNQSPAYAVSWVLNKVKEYKQVKEKCCPKKGKK